VTDGPPLKGVLLFGTDKLTNSLVMTRETRHVFFVDTVYVEGLPGYCHPMTIVLES